MFVKKCEALTASMVRPFPPSSPPLPSLTSHLVAPQPDTVLAPVDPSAVPVPGQQQQQPQQGFGSQAAQAAAESQPGIVNSAGGAAGALAGWAFASVSKKVRCDSFCRSFSAGRLC